MRQAEYRIIIDDPTCRGMIVEIFGTNILPVHSLDYNNLPSLTKDGEKLAFELDISRLTLEQRARLAAYLAGRFHLDFSEVERDLERHGRASW